SRHAPARAPAAPEIDPPRENVADDAGLRPHLTYVTWSILCRPIGSPGGKVSSLTSSSRRCPQGRSREQPAYCRGEAKMDAGQLEGRRAQAKLWFEALRDDICAAFERIEDDAPAALYGDGPGRFVRTPWSRTDHTGAPGGGGVMSMMKGRVFEKV